MVKRVSADTCAQFGFAVTDRREVPGLKQGQFAERAGIHRTDLSDIERGPRRRASCVPRDSASDVTEYRSCYAA
jgi:hypothetical protein